MTVRVMLEIAARREFDYLVPPEMEDALEVGSRVRVPLGSRQVLGCVTAINPDSVHTCLKSIVKVVGAKALVTPKILALARWIADYYCCATETALRCALPDSVRREKSGWREHLRVRLVSTEAAPPKLTARQKEILESVRQKPGARVTELARDLKTTGAVLRRLEDKGLLSIAPEISERDPYHLEVIVPTKDLVLNPDQKKAFERIQAALDAAVANEAAGRELKPFLIHGVTGSGKTEVYLQAIAHALRLGKGAIVLVPEISLTPQTVERFKARFSDGPLQTLVAVLHSHLSAGEKHDEWHKIRQGRARIVIGARSAIFAPVEPLGLIIVDEEHESSYKQGETPRYHARDVAVVRARMEGAVVALGSATPSLESYHNVKTGKYELIEMPARADDKKMPIVRVVDMRQLARLEKATPVLSPQLREAILQRIERKEQTILFLNRRGFATSMQCPQCGYVAQCPNCSVSLTYHRWEQKLRCHICGHAGEAPSVCPDAKCRNPAIRYSGLGTEKVEHVLSKTFPQARLQRMDSDSLKRKDDYRRILGDFRIGKIDILVGTQMIAKGLHFPNVTLVGIIYADLGLHQPDFRAGERTFQLLTQVSGRAGRGDVEGEVFVQAFTPFAPAIQYARRHDFEGYYDQEIEFRAQLDYPPLSRIAMLTLKGRNEEKVSFTARHLKKELEEKTGDFRGLVLAGPAPAPLARAETHYRYQIMLRTRQMTKLSRLLATVTAGAAMPEDVTLTVDIDPVNLV
jgi:primosomal protein N' (replication factor Y)